ncbi:MAG: galactosyldiacylglycerol synthase [Verrucomicrobiota bacterium]
MMGGALILTAGFGEGHNAAARSLKAAFDMQHETGSAQIYDVFSEARPSLNRWMRSAYLELINKHPNLWSWIFQSTDNKEIPAWFLRALEKEADFLKAHILETQPAVLCSTYPLYSFLLKQIQDEFVRKIPHFVVVTDSISVHSLWWRAEAEGWFLPNQDSADVLRKAQIPEAKLEVLGFPVAPFFSTHLEELRPPDLASGAKPRVLFLVHSGYSDAEETARKLLQETRWEVTCAVGRNERLRERLKQLAAHRREPTQILGWTQDIPALLMTHHAIISKAGGATTQEAIAAACPMIVNQIVPGQEEGNFELLCRLEAGSRARTPGEVLAILEDWFEDGGRGWKKRRHNLQAASKPTACFEIVRRLLPFMKRPPGTK